MKIYRLYIHPIFILSFISMLFFSSCVVDDQDNEIVDTTGNTNVTFTLQMPGQVEGGKTYALNESNENEVKTIEILAFDTNGAYQYIAYSDVITDNGSTDKKKFTVKLVKGTSDLVILANARSIINNSYPTGIPLNTPKATVLSSLKMDNANKWITNTSLSTYKAIPMWGKTGNLTINESTTISDIKMIRMLAKVDVALSTDLAKANFQLKSVRLYNYNSKGSLIPTGVGTWDDTNSKALLPNVPTDATKTLGPLVYENAEITTANISSISEIYTFEAVKGTSANSSQNTCLVIGGVYIPDNTTYYYRIDFSNTVSNVTTYLDLLRNYSYKVNITKISGPGFTNATSAFNAGPVNITANISAWNDGGLSDISFNGQYALGVSESNITLSKEQTYSGITVSTSYTGATPRWTAVSSDSWLTLSSTSSAIEKSVLLYTATENTTGLSRSATITITTGLIVKTIYIVQGTDSYPLVAVGESNSYIVAPHSLGVMLPVSRANADLTTRIGASDAFTGNLIWTDNINGLSLNSPIHRILRVGTGSSGKIIAVPGTVEGNALISAEVGTDATKIKWTWHIWVTNYTTPTGISIGTFLNRNMGALSGTQTTVRSEWEKTVGVVYQFGRSNPMPSTIGNVYGASGITPLSVSTTTTNTLASAIQNPLSMMTSGWTGSAAGNSWNTLLGAKTVYDPCPIGWRVPKVLAWASLLLSNFPVSGTWTDPNATGGRSNASIGGFYPGAGYRIDNTISQVGTAGFYWGALASATVGYSSGLVFGPSTLETNYNINYHVAISVRCVSETSL